MNNVRNYRKSMRIKLGFNFYDVFVVLFTVGFGLLCFYPMWYVFLGSITPYSDFSKTAIPFLPPLVPDLSYYKAILQTGVFYNALTISFAKTLFGSAASVLLTATMAYAVSKTHVRGMPTINWLVVMTMFFSGGLIPTYLLIRDLHMLNTFWALTVPWFLGATNFIIMRNYFVVAVPNELEEAAKIDGANDVTIFFRIVLPLSKPTMAAMFLFDAVFHWNDWYSYLIYAQREPSLRPVVWVLKEMLTDPATAGGSSGSDIYQMSRMLASFPPVGLKMTTIILSMLPIILFYPFLQKYFVKGILIGAVKG